METLLLDVFIVLPLLEHAVFFEAEFSLNLSDLSVSLLHHLPKLLNFALLRFPFSLESIHDRGQLALQTVEQVFLGHFDFRTATESVLLGFLKSMGIVTRSLPVSIEEVRDHAAVVLGTGTQSFNLLHKGRQACRLLQEWQVVARLYYLQLRPPSPGNLVDRWGLALDDLLLGISAQCSIQCARAEHVLAIADLLF